MKTAVFIGKHFMCLSEVMTSYYDGQTVGQEQAWDEDRSTAVEDEDPKPRQE